MILHVAVVKAAKGVKGLKMYHRSCRVFNGLDKNVRTMLREDISVSSTAPEKKSQSDNSTNQNGTLQENKKNVVCCKMWS